MKNHADDIAIHVRGENEMLLYAVGDTKLYAILCITDACDSHGVYFIIHRPNGTVDMHLDIKSALEDF